jgi:hypothetical protein
MVELTRTLLLPPKGSKTIFLKFPVEIGVILTKGNSNRIIDVFTEIYPKYALYGDLKEGILCRYFGSDVHVKPPKADSSMEGIAKVVIKNNTVAWREVSKLVFNGRMMKLYYSKDLVSFSASARILDDEKVETKFSDKPWKKGQTKSFEMITQRSLSLPANRFTMEGGY